MLDKILKSLKILILLPIVLIMLVFFISIGSNGIDKWEQIDQQKAETTK